MKLVLNRKVKSSLIGGKKFEIACRIEGDRDLAALFKGYPDELVMAFKSAFVDRGFSLKRSEIIRGARFNVSSLNEIIELEDRLIGAVEQLRRMIEIVDSANSDIDFEE